jgi:uncharacterized protein YndB with AHSA1/START domain
MRITFDRTIPTVLSDEQLWRLLVLSFRNSDESPIWPHDLETIRSAAVESGALVRSVYKGPGGMQSHVTYRLADVKPGRRLSYFAEPSHPLRGGGTVEVSATPTGSVLHWYGGYEVPWRLPALAAAVFTRGYFTGRFFGTLERKLGEWGRGEEYHNE